MKFFSIQNIDIQNDISPSKMGISEILSAQNVENLQPDIFTL
jgi:hypothetical protein